jgi:hypothetical protein
MLMRQTPRDNLVKRPAFVASAKQKTEELIKGS